MHEQELVDEFDRQRKNLVDKGFPAIAGMPASKLCDLLEPLRTPVLNHAASLGAPTRARVPFVLVISRNLAAPSAAMQRTTLNGRSGFVSRDTADIDHFEPVGSVSLPTGDAYAVFDIDRGKETLNVSPDDAMSTISMRGRSPLTVEEGIAFILHYPDALEKNNCFQLLGSRRDDRRVPGIWISQKMPKLGFCWAGNRHTWLGAASCAGRAGTDGSMA